MRVIETKVYSFEELSEQAKQKAIDELININVTFDWWDNTYEDAKNIGLKITSFGLDRNSHAEGKFLISEEEVAEKIIKEHGETCENFKTAQKFLLEFRELQNKDTFETEEEEEENDELITYLREEFLTNILEDYSIMLQNECEYLQSDEAIIETINANEYEFTAEGKLI